MHCATDNLSHQMPGCVCVCVGGGGGGGGGVNEKWG